MEETDDPRRTKSFSNIKKSLLHQNNNNNNYNNNNNNNYNGELSPEINQKKITLNFDSKDELLISLNSLNDDDNNNNNKI